MRYVVIIPAYNEAKFIEGTLISLCRQTLLPIRLIVVDDGSSDETPDIVQGYMRKFPWMQLVKKQKGERAVGSKVVEAFNAGYKAIPPDLEYDFIVKLDADLELPADYFNRASAMFSKYPEVGICGGYCVIPEGADWVREATAPMHIRGAFKAIRRKAFEEIGGFMPVMGWDGFDQIGLLFKGWKIGLIDCPVKHFRPTGEATNKQKLYSSWGVAAYQRGYDLVLAISAAFVIARRTGEKENFLFYMRGFLSAVMSRQPKLLSAPQIRFLRKLQYGRMISERTVLAEYSRHE